MRVLPLPSSSDHSPRAHRCARGTHGPGRRRSPVRIWERVQGDIAAANHSLAGDILGCLSLFLTLVLLLTFAGALS